MDPNAELSGRGVLARTPTLLAAFLLSCVLLITVGLARANAATTVDFGISVTSDDAGLLAQTEDDIGRTVDFVRVFKTWDNAFPTANDQQILEGREVLLSVRPRTNAGVEIPWVDIAAAQPGDPLYQDMVDWASALAPYEDQIYFNFHHEPEARLNLAHGTAPEFIAAWRNFMTILAGEGFEPLGRVFIATDFGFQVPSTDRRATESWYPGDAWVEAIAADAYNWYDCRAGINTPWLSLAEIIEGIRVFGEAHPNEDLILAEFGSVEDSENPNRKAEWLADAQALFAEPDYAQFTAVAYFSLLQQGGTINCDWSIGTSPQSVAAFAALAADPFYGGGTAPPPVAPPPPVGDGSCVATPNGTGFDLLWEEVGRTSIRRSGAWLHTVNSGVQSFSDTSAPIGSTYEVRVFTNAGRVDINCVIADPPVDPPVPPVDPPVPPVDPPVSVCVGTVDGTTVLLEWDLDGLDIVRRDGAWLATPESNATSFEDLNAPVDATYVIRNRAADGTFTDYECVLDGEVSPPVPVPVNGCVAAAGPGGVTLTWDVPDDAVIRKNGAWLTTLRGPQTFTDPTGTAADSYVLRSRATGVPVDFPCQ